MAVIQGTAADDNLVGTADADTIFGNDGNDTLNGGAGADLLVGGAGNDLYIVDNVGDQSIDDGLGTDTVRTTVSYTLVNGSTIEFLTAATAAGVAIADGVQLTGNNNANTITGGTGNDLLDGGPDPFDAGGNAVATADSLVGGLGNDTYIVRNATDVIVEGIASGADQAAVFSSYTLAGGVEVEALFAADATGTGAFALVGNATAQTIVGNAGNNALTGGGGADTLVGLGGNDTYSIESNTVVVTENAGGGTDTVNITQANGGNAVTYTLASDLETIGITGTGLINVTGGTISQTINGNGSRNVIDGGGGVDSLAGAAGDDSYVVDSQDDTVIELTGANGTDRVSAASSNYVLAQNGITGFVEVLTGFNGGGITNQSIGTAVQQSDATLNLNAITNTSNTSFFVGNTLSQVIFGNNGSNIVNGYRNGGDETVVIAPGAGADTLVGLNGDDQYRVYDQSDVVVEDNAGGGDIIYTSASYSLATNDTTVIGGGAVALDLGTITFGGAANYINSAQEIEVLSASTQAGTAAINLGGNATGNIIIGNFGANTIVGGGTAGNAGSVDVLFGLQGSDTYYTTSTNTFINESAGEGTDLAYVGVTGFVLNGGSSIETLILANVTVGATGAVTAPVGLDGILTGNDQNQLIQSTAAGAFSNTLVGGGGNDTLQGFLANDVYLVDSQTDVVLEDAVATTPGAGFDTIFTSVSYDLRASGAGGAGTQAAVEVLAVATQAGTEAINLTGNEFVNTLVGNNGDNILNGDNDSANGTAAGDRLVGLGGNDTYRVYSQSDVVVEAGNAAGGANDVVFASASYELYGAQGIETLSASNQAATTAGISLRGNELGNVVIGNDGVNTIDGGSGNDLLIGRGGEDILAFTTALDAATNVDTIVGFTAGDRIGLATGANGIFNAIAGAGTAGLDIGEFRNGTTALDGDDFILYNQATGEIFYDADANLTASAPILFARVDPGIALGFNDFTTVAGIAPGTLLLPVAPTAPV